MKMPERKSMEDTESLSELMELIGGRGKYRHFGTGISTYPTGDDNNKKIHGSCLELEKRHLIHRQIDTGTSVFWMPGRDLTPRT